MEHYDLCVIGSGSGNSLIDERFTDQRVALVDKGVFGGTCLNVGCIPTKMFVRAAAAAASREHARRLGVDIGEVKVDWPAIRDRIFGRIDPISAGGLQWRESNHHVAVYRDEAHFLDPTTLQVGPEQISADRFVLAAGSRPVIPDVPGVDEVSTRLHTSDTIMRLQRLPRSMVIVGGGFIAAEFAGIFQALGTSITVINRSDVLLSREDREIAEVFTAETGKRMAVRLRQYLDGFERGPRDLITVLTTDAHGIEYSYEADVVLIARGRVPNSDTLNLSAAGVQVDEEGYVVVDENQRTTAEHIWALGDLASPWQLKHVANHEMRVVQHNLLHPDEPARSDHRFVPHAVFGMPEVASVGLTEEQAREQGLDYVVGRYRFADVAYGWALEDEGAHLAKVIVDRASLRILGGHIVGPDAAMLLQPLIQAMSTDVDAATMARGQYWIHPALSEVVENALLQAVDATEHIGPPGLPPDC